MGQTVRFHEILRRLAIIDESLLEHQAEPRRELRGSGLVVEDPVADTHG